MDETLKILEWRLLKIKVVIAFILFYCLSTLSFALGDTSTKTKLINRIEGEVIYGKDRPIRISAIKNNPPFSFILPNGQIAGLYIDIWRLWSEQSGIPVEFQLDDYSVNIAALKNGNSDFHSGLFLSEERYKTFDFSIPIHSVATQIYYASEYEGEISIKDLDGKSVGVGEGSFQESYIREHHPEMNLKAYFDPEDTIKNLIEGNIDAIISEQPFIDAQLGIMAIEGVFKQSKEPFSVNTVHAMFLKNNHVLSELINNGLSNIPVEQLVALEKKWLSSLPSYFEKKAIPFLKTLSFKQQVWLRRFPKLKTLFNSSLSPIEFVNSQEQFSGISFEYSKIVEEKLNIQLVVTPIDSWSSALKAVSNKDVDLLTAAIPDVEQAERMNFSSSYIGFPNVIVTHNELGVIQSIEELSLRKIAVVKDYWIGQIVQVNNPNLELIFVDDISQGLEKLQDKLVDAYIGNLAVVSQNIKQNNRGELNIVGLMPYTSEYSFAIRKGLEPLVPIINSALRSIIPEDKASIRKNWMAFEITDNFYSKILIKWGIPISLVFTVFILFVFFSNRKKEREISIRTTMEKHLLEETRNAENANKAKDNFLSNMSHEIRTPMNAVLGISHLLRGTKLVQEQKEYLNILDGSAKSLLKLIDDILSRFNHPETKIEFHLEDFSLNLLVKDIINQVSVRINSEKAQRVALKSSIALSVPTYIHGDSLRVGQVFINLLTNAIKFTEKGNIELNAERIATDDKGIVKLLCSVKDSGIGMSTVQLDSLFSDYAQVDPSISRIYGGTGLGLSISKKLCELMNGEIWVESQLDSGSTFYFIIELAVSQTQNVINTHSDLNKVDVGMPKNSTININSIEEQESNQLMYYSSLLTGKKILVVDDNNVNLMIIRKMLEKYGVTITTAVNGLEAVELFFKEKHDAVLMDLQMPEMDGFQATKLIHTSDEYNGTPIIALSANVLDKDIKKSLASGMVSHLAKPVKIHILAKEIVLQIRRANGRDSQ